jgi:hypothetical protein
MIPVCAIPANVIETVLAFIVPFIMPITNHNMQPAREAAWHMLGDYHVRTSEEFRLAGEIISFSLQALTALANAAEPGLSFQKLCRYRAAAVSLKRAGTQAQRQFDALRKAPAAEEGDATLGELPPYAAPDVLGPEVDPTGECAAMPHAAAPHVQRAGEPAPEEALADVPAQADQTPNLTDRAHHLLEAARQAGNAGNHAHARQLAADARKASLAQQIRDGAKRKQAEHAQIEAATEAYFAAAAHSGEAARATT